MEYHQERRDICINMNESLNIMSQKKCSKKITVQHDLYILYSCNSTRPFKDTYVDNESIKKCMERINSNSRKWLLHI